MKTFALIVAGGSGSRMGADIPKQFLLLGQKPVLMHTLERFASAKCELILVLPQPQIEYWNALCKQYQFTLKHTIVSGGSTRFHSVQNGLNQIHDNGLVAIHDGVRPCISVDLIEQSFALAVQKGNAVTAVKPKDSIREIVNETSNQSVNRDDYRLIQTPQTFQLHQIKEAYQKATHSNFTDDAGVLESAGYAIHLFEGHYSNIKITTPEDLKLAEILLSPLPSL